MKNYEPRIEINWAEPADARAIADVLRRSFAEYQTFYTDKAFAATTPASDVIKKRFDEGALWKAVLDGQIVGTVSTFQEKNALYLRSMAVLPVARGLKIGERLLKQIEDFAVERKFRRLILSTTPFLNSAIRLYEKCGFAFSDEGAKDLFGTPLLTMIKDLKLSEKK